MKRIENWSLQGKQVGENKRLEVHLTGTCEGQPYEAIVVPDVRTALVADECGIVVRNECNVGNADIVLLGAVDPEYEKHYPGALERVMGAAVANKLVGGIG